MSIEGLVRDGSTGVGAVCRAISPLEPGFDRASFLGSPELTRSPCVVRSRMKA